MNPTQMLLNKLVSLSSKIQGLEVYRTVGRRLCSPISVRSVSQEEACLALKSLFYVDYGNHPSHGTPFVAFYRKKPVGFVELIRNDSLAKNDTSHWLSGLYVRYRFRGLGIGEALCQAVINTALSEDVSVLSLLVSVPNTTAQQLYRKLGFVVVTDTQELTRLEVVSDPDNPYLVMQKWLR